MCVLLASEFAPLIEAEKHWLKVEGLIYGKTTFDYYLSPSRYPRGLLRSYEGITIVNTLAGIQGKEKVIMQKNYSITEVSATGYLFTKKKKYERLQEEVEDYLFKLQMNKLEDLRLKKIDAILRSSLNEIEKEISLYNLNKGFDWQKRVAILNHNFRKYVREYIDMLLRQYRGYGYLAIGRPINKVVVKSADYLVCYYPEMVGSKGVCLDTGIKISVGFSASTLAYYKILHCVCCSDIVRYRLAVSIASSPFTAYSYVEDRLKRLGLPTTSIIMLAKMIYDLSDVAKGLISRAVSYCSAFSQEHAGIHIPFLPKDIKKSEIEELEKKRILELKPLCCKDCEFAHLVEQEIYTCFAPSIFGGFAVSLITSYNYRARKIIISISASPSDEGTIKIVKPKTVASLKDAEGNPIAVVIDDTGNVKITSIKDGMTLKNEFVIPIGITPEDFKNIPLLPFGHKIWIEGQSISDSYYTILTTIKQSSSSTTSTTYYGMQYVGSVFPVLNFVDALKETVSSFSVNYYNGFMQYSYNITETINITTLIRDFEGT